jgi:CheY-like chemotaxis protein
VLADYGQLEQVLVNLAINARDAMPDGGTLTIDTENVEVDAAYAGGRPGLDLGRYVRLRVSDDGVGMDRSVAARVFEPFFTTKPKGQGTGLGLATVYGIVTQTGGDVRLYSEPGVGTTFSILLPTTDAAVPEQTRQPVRPPRAGGGETILVVDDEPAVLEVTRRILADHDYDVLPANGGPEALRIAEDHDGEIALLVTDVVMPDMLGKEVAERVRAGRPQISVLYMSGYAQAVVEPGADAEAIIDKPFSAATLLGRVRETLDARARAGH